MDNMMSGQSAIDRINQAAAPQQQVTEVTPFDILLQSSIRKEEAQKKEIGLKTLRPSEVEKIMASYKRGKKVADDYYDATIKPKLKERDEAYLAKESYYQRKFPILSETSRFCSRDIKTTVDWMLPSLCEPFIGSDDPVDIRGVNVNDDEKAKKIQQLLKYQLQRKNSYPLFIDSIWRDALRLNYAVAKVYWKRDEERERYEFLMSRDDMQAVSIIQQAQVDGKAELIDQKPLKDAPDLVVVSFDKVTVKSNYPVVQYMSPSELRFTPDARSVQDAKFKAHRKIVSGDYLRRKEQEGIYQDVDKAIEAFGGDAAYDTYDTDKNRALSTIQSKLSDDDEASKRFELYEAYLCVDYNNDGIMENLIVHAVGDVPIRIVKNDFDIAPFFVAYAEVDPAQPFNANESFTENLLQQQDLKTAIFKQIITNVAKNNSPRVYVNENVDVDAFLNNEEVILIRGNEDPRASVYGGEQLNMSPMSMQVVEYAQNEIESQSGSTRYNQGLDSNSLNKTATGITAIMGSAEKRMKHMARVFAETFVLPMMKYLILLNQKYLDNEQIVRLADENIEIRKEELDVDVDLVINVGLGAGTKEAQIQFLMILINQIYPALMQVGIVNAQSWYEIVKDLLEKMGIPNSDKYLVDPSSQQAQLLQMQAQQQAQQAQQQAMQLEQMKAQYELEKARQPRVSLGYDDLPYEAQLQLLRYLGINVNTADLVEKEAMEYAKKAKTNTTVVGEKQQRPNSTSPIGR